MRFFIFYIAPCIGLQVAVAQYAANQTNQDTCVSALTTHETYGFTSHPKDEAVVKGTLQNW